MQETRLIIQLKPDTKEPGTKFGEKHDSFYEWGRVRRLWLEKGNKTVYQKIPASSEAQEVKVKEELSKAEYDAYTSHVPEITVFSDMYEYHDGPLRMYYEKISTRKGRGLAKHVWSTEIEKSRPTWKKQLDILEQSFDMTDLGNTSTRKMCEAVHRKH